MRPRRPVSSLLLLSLLLGLVTSCVAGSEPPTPEVCECGPLEAWIYQLPILPDRSAFTEGATLSESLDGFSGGVSGSIGVDDVYKRRVVDALEVSDLEYAIRSDTEERWEVVIKPELSRDIPANAWTARLVYTDGGLGFSLRVEASGEPYGYETLSDLQDHYRQDRDEAIDVSRQRQLEAIELLEPLKQALLTLGNS